ncbi:hypothetical protein [[Phormidium] sp. ETS-05]|uniref:hypothetical protein n=1 Tax=[Phormidium] sp. ETS-05 TaxID=222819 RepID=UPI0018EF1543|nr:hypothetical protein [[Phormidium] sp. ETS-05]
MSSASPGRYQSRLFNFLSSQTLRVKEGLAQTLRHLKVKVNWGLEALLYQLRAISAIVKRAGKRLGQGFSPKHTLEGNTEATAKSATTLPGSNTAAAAQLPATPETEAKQLPQGTIDPDLMINLSESPITDSPLSLLFESLDAKVAQLEAGGWQQVPQALGGAVVKAIQGVRLPAVPEEEITTQGQQFPEKIAALLRAAVAYFFGGTAQNSEMPPEQAQEQLNVSESPSLPGAETGGLLSLGAKFRQSVLKVRQKVGLPAVPEEEITTQGQQFPEKIAALLRAAVAYFFGGTAQNSEMPPEQAQEQLNVSESPSLPGAETGGLLSLGAKFRQSVVSVAAKAQHQIERWGTALVSDREFAPEPLPDRMENLIRAAVDYFLRLGKTSLPADAPNEAWRGDGETGRRGDGVTGRQGAKAQLQMGELAGELEGDLWQEQAGAALNGSESLSIPNAREMARSLRRKVQEAVKAAPLVPKSQVTTGKPQVVNETQAVATGGAATLELERATAAQTEWQPDFLETRAVVTGYVKHPLELVLEWLDRALVWAETIIGKLWRLGMQWWQGLQNRTK